MGCIKKLKNCPFCNHVPYYPTNLKKNKSLTSCANNKCAIFGVMMTIKQWNKRFEIEDKSKIKSSSQSFNTIKN